MSSRSSLALIPRRPSETLRKIGECLYDKLVLICPSNTWLFDSAADPNRLDRQIGSWLDNRTSTAFNSGVSARDLLSYYLGHGIFDEDRDYCLWHKMRQMTQFQSASGACAVASRRAIASSLSCIARRSSRSASDGIQILAMITLGA